MEKCGFRFHHTEEGNVSPLGDVRTEHFLRLTKEEWGANIVSHKDIHRARQEPAF